MARKRKRRKMSALQKKYFGKRKHKAKRRTNPVRVLLANPRRRKRSRKARKSHAMVPRRRRRARRHVAHMAPRRRRRRLHARKHSPIKRHHRRINPGRFRLSSLKSLAKVAFFGGVGVLSARTGSFLYNKYLAKEVAKVNTMLSDVARLAAMAGMTLGVEYGLRRAVKLSPANCLAIKIGGLGETGRQAIGMTVGKMLPSFNRGNVGLDGVTIPYGYYDSSVMGGELEEDGMDGLEPAEMFDGLEQADMFDGVGPSVGYGYRAADSHYSDS